LKEYKFLEDFEESLKILEKEDGETKKDAVNFKAK
jgi:hypothetical protein